MGAALVLALAITKSFPEAEEGTSLATVDLASLEFGSFDLALDVVGHDSMGHLGA